jgi:biotin transport system substrate-specific component
VWALGLSACGGGGDGGFTSPPPPPPGGGGGLAVFFGVTGGYLVSWPIGALVVGLLTERFWGRYNLAWGILANVVGGMVVVYAIGVPWLAVAAHLSLTAAIVSGALPFLVGDLIKAVVAAVIAVQVRRSYPVIERPRRAAAVR